MIRRKADVSQKKIGVKTQVLLDTVVDLHNLFLDLEPSSWDRLIKGKGIEDILLQRQAVIKGRLVDAIDEYLGEKLRLPRTSPFKLDVEELKKLVN